MTSTATPTDEWLEPKKPSSLPLSSNGSRLDLTLKIPHTDDGTSPEDHSPPKAGPLPSPDGGSSPDLSGKVIPAHPQSPKASTPHLAFKSPHTGNGTLPEASSPPKPGSSSPPKTKIFSLPAPGLLLLPESGLSASLQPEPLSSLNLGPPSLPAPGFSMIRQRHPQSPEQSPSTSCVVYSPPETTAGNAADMLKSATDSIMGRPRPRKANNVRWEPLSPDPSRLRPNPFHFDAINAHERQFNVNGRIRYGARGNCDGIVVRRNFAPGAQHPALRYDHFWCTHQPPCGLPVGVDDDISYMPLVRTKPIHDEPSGVRCRQLILSRDAAQKRANLERRAEDWKHDLKDFHRRYPRNIKVSEADHWWMSDKMDEIERKLLPSTESVKLCAKQLSEAVHQVRKHSKAEGLAKEMLWMQIMAWWFERKAHHQAGMLEKEVRKWREEDGGRVRVPIREQIEKMMME